jgi:hypothetical protein
VLLNLPYLYFDRAGLFQQYKVGVGRKGWGARHQSAAAPPVAALPTQCAHSQAITITVTNHHHPRM